MRGGLGPASCVLLWLTASGCHWVFPYGSGAGSSDVQGDHRRLDAAGDLTAPRPDRADLPASDRRATDVFTGCPAGCVTCKCVATACHLECSSLSITCTQGDSTWICNVTFAGGGFATNVVATTGPCEPCASVKAMTRFDAQW